jgi:ferric-dicitrate binding protein FerR (iron transport regulator)
MADWFDLSAYFAGDGDPAERKALEAWFNETPERQAQLRRLRLLWEARQRQPVRDFGRDEAIAQVLSVIRDAKPRAPERSLKPVVPGRRGLGGGVFHSATARYLVGALAAGAAILAIGVRKGQWFGTRAESVSVLTYATGPGQRANITLPDGSTVVLNVASRLQVPSNYAAGNHTVRLQGQASFAVQHHDAVPLIVVSGSVTTRVLGTRFMVRRYATDTAIVVAVRDGRVAVEADQSRVVVLAADQQATIGAFGAPRVTVADASQFDFERGTLTIASMPLRDAIAELDRWYDADIQLADSTLGDLRLTSRLTAGSVAELATMLEMTFNVRVVRNNRTLTLYQR